MLKKPRWQRQGRDNRLLQKGMAAGLAQGGNPLSADEQGRWEEETKFGTPERSDDEILGPAHEVDAVSPAKKSASFASSKHSASLQFEQTEGHQHQRESDMASVISSESEMDNTRKQLEELQIRTIFSLVEPLEIEVGSRTLKKKLLFITNKQARKFDFTDLSRVVGAMDITPAPQLVINLLPSFFRQGPLAEAACGGSEAVREKLLEFHMHGEMDKKGVEEFELNVMLFLQQYVLPVAIQTNALVLMHADDCLLSKAFSELCEATTEKMGGKLPFTSLCIYSGSSLEISSNTPGTVAHALRMQSTRWKGHGEKLRLCAEAKNGEQSVDWSPVGLPAGCTHYIIVDAVTHGKSDVVPRDLFKNTFMQRLSDELPSIGIATNNKTSAKVLSLFEDYVGRRLPLLVLDGRARQTPYPCDLQAADKDLSDLAQALEASGTVNKGLVSMLAYLCQVLRRAENQRATKDRAIRVSSTAKGDGWIWQVLGRLNSELLLGDSDEAAATKQAAAMQAARVLEKQYSAAEATTWKLRAAKFRETAKAITDLNTKAGLDVFLRELSVFLAYFGDASRVQKLATVFPHKLQLRQIFEAGRPFTKVLSLADSCTDADVVELTEQLSSSITSWAEDCDQTYERSLERTFLRKHLMAAYNVFLSADVHTCNITDTRKISQLISQVAKIDRMPQNNSREAIHVIRATWDHVDVYMASANSHKQLAKLLYALLLIIGAGIATVVTITLQSTNSTCLADYQGAIDNGTSPDSLVPFMESCIVSTTSGSIPQLISRENAQYVILGLSVLSTLIASAVSYLNPAQRWQQLRGAALALESEVWKFRTRVGPYAATDKLSIGGYSREPERCLLEYQAEVAQRVLKSAAIGETALHSRFELFGRSSKKVTKYTHGQYEGSGIHGTFGQSNIELKSMAVITVFQDFSLRKLFSNGRSTFNVVEDDKSRGKYDDHQSPLHAAEYLEFRVKPVVDFFMGRLPRYYFSRTTAQALLLFATVCSTVLAFFELATWASIPTAAATAITAWQEFSGTDKKLSRYSGAIERLSSITTWWGQLSDVEQANLTNLHNLILSCEEVLEREREAWLSTSMATKTLSQAAEADKDKDGDDGGSAPSTTTV